MLGSREKQLPELVRYLNAAVAADRAVVTRETGRTTLLLAALLALWLLVPLGCLAAFQFSAVGVAASLLSWAASVPLFSLFRQANQERRKPKTDQQRIHFAAMEVARAMQRSRRLHKELDSTAGVLLEESARYWSEVSEILTSPRWTDPNLAPHWQAISNQTLLAADQAMDEGLVLLKGSFQPGKNQGGFEGVIENVIETFVTGPRPYKSGHLPVGFDQAREVAEKLKLAAAGLKNVIPEIAGPDGVVVARKPGAALDAAMSDLRSVQEAESELRQNLRG